jgi:eukaryotic-like serine/threonine-protein kinase
MIASNNRVTPWEQPTLEDRDRNRDRSCTANAVVDAAPMADRDSVLTSMISPLEETAIQDVRARTRTVDRADGGCLSELVGGRLGAYRIDGLLGRGSMACVYKARHLALDRDCALKIMDSALVSRHPDVRERFWAEARAVANLVHPHIVTIYNLGSDDGHHFIEMEYVPGGRTLRDWLVKDGPLDPALAVPLARQVVLALGAAHDAGLVHRDIKPANVLLTQQGEAKLADFGLVGRLEELAHAGAPLAGTPTFMAPELFQGTPASAASDIYAVGVLMFHCLSGRLPITADSISQLIQLHRTQPVPDIREVAPGVPESLAEIVAKCLLKDPEDRYATAAELAEALQDFFRRLPDIENLVRECAQGLDCFIQGHRDTFRLIVSLPDDRLQEVIVEASEGANQEPVLSVFSVCGPADLAHYEYALRLNGQLTYGSISVHDVLGIPMFVMSRSFSRDSVRAEDLRSAIIEIARRSDRIEKKLTRMDQY